MLAIAEANATRRPASSATFARRRAPVGAAYRVEQGPRYLELVFDAPEDFAARHVVPAQYITMGLGEAVEPRYLVLANAPGERRWRCLIGKDSTLGEALGAFEGSARELGEALRVSAPEGIGFDVTRALDEEEQGGDQLPLVMLTTGSGVATMHSVLRWLELAHPSQLRSSTLFYGEQSEGTGAYTRYLRELEQRGVAVTMAYEAPADAAYPWQYVQQPWLQRADDALFARGLFLLSGARPMLRFATHALLERGVDEGRILLNV